MTLTDELDRRVNRIDKLLQQILRLFLLGELSSFLARLRAKELLEAEYESFMLWFVREYKTPEEYKQKANRIRAVLHKILEDFEKVVDTRTEEEQEKRKLRLRVYLISIALIYNLFHASTVELAISLKVMIKWVAVLDARTCEICRELDGTIYDPTKETPPQRPHPSCRCRLELYVVMRK